LAPAPVGGPDARGAAAEALTRHARTGRPPLVVLDDAQWFDSLSLDALLTACREAGGALLLASLPVGREGARPTSAPAPDLVLGP
ncbi:ATP-binding protein, partial [Streptomyces sp. TRM76130]|nr:ATP-binding protein [Streptomyces sp. TRM76130]